jgi:hypothetical protein
VNKKFREIEVFKSEIMANHQITVDFANLRTLDQIQSAYETLKIEEDRTEQDLETLLFSHRFIEVRFSIILLEYGTHHSYVLVVHTLRVAENEILKLDLPAKRH